MFSKMTCELLYVPFNSDYEIDADIRQKLTLDEFFEKCYVEPETQRINGEVGSAEIDCEDALQRFYRWISTNSHAIYCIKGEAGIGKSTFVHYLQYEHQKENMANWEIVDVQKADQYIYFLGLKIEIPSFNLLYGKVGSAIILNILSQLFGNLKPERKEDIEKIISRLKRIHERYMSSACIYPREVLRRVFHTPQLWKYIKENAAVGAEELIGYANEVKAVITDIISGCIRAQQIEELLTLYSSVLFAQEGVTKHILAFDNLERFVGNDEIQNRQIDDFLTDLRHCLDAFNKDDPTFSSRMQAVVFIRNTTARMSHLSLQLGDHPGHEMDISGWFPIEKIVSQKVMWYHNHNISVTNEQIISCILGKIRFDGSGRINAQHRLEYLFNRNNRLVIEFLSQVIVSMNAEVLRCFRKYAQRDTENSRFAARQIITRLVLDELRKDGLWGNLMVESAGQDNTRRSGYARKILTILHNYSGDNRDKYMGFDDFIKILDGGDSANNYTDELVENYFDKNAKSRRTMISQILYYMNYYNVREKRWLQFIDIQLQTDKRSVQIKNPEELYRLIDDEHKNIGMRITLSGTTYVMHLIHTFEYFSCRMSGDRTLPLLCTIPTLEDLWTEKLDNLICIKIIKRVRDDMNECIRIMKERANTSPDIQLRKKTRHYVSHTKQIMSSYNTFISKFIDCVKEEFEGTQMSDEDNERLCALTERLREYSTID